MPGERTEKATPKRRRDERKKGNVLQSKDIVTVFTLIGGFYALKLTFMSSYSALKGCMLKYFSYMQNKAENENLESYLKTKIFAGESGNRMEPVKEDVAGFEKFMERYMAGLSIEHAAVDAF